MMNCFVHGVALVFCPVEMYAQESEFFTDARSNEWRVFPYSCGEYERVYPVEDCRVFSDVLADAVAEDVDCKCRTTIFPIDGDQVSEV